MNMKNKKVKNKKIINEGALARRSNGISNRNKLTDIKENIFSNWHKLSENKYQIAGNIPSKNHRYGSIKNNM